VKKNTPMPTFTYKPIVHRGEKRILILFAYNAKIVAELRQKTNAKWSKTHKAWHIADTVEHRIKCKLPVENEAHIEKKVVPAPALAPQKNNTTVEKKINTQQVKETLPTLLLQPIQYNKEERIGLFVATNKTIRDAIKRLNAVKWCENLKCWHVPCTEIHYEAVCQALKGMVMMDAKPLKQFLEKRKTVHAIQKNVGYKKPATVGQVFVISQHNMLLLQRMVEHLQLKAYSASTLRTYKNEVGIFLQTLKNKKADTLTTEDLRRYLHYCIEKLQLSENTLHSRLNALKFLYEQLLGHEKFFFEIPRPKKHLQLPKVLGEEELRRLFNAPTNLKHKAILFVAYSAGLRVSEVINLRLQDIDRERQQLFIHCSKGKKDRYVMLSPMVLDVLEQYYKMSVPKPTNYLFEGYEKGQPYTIRSAQKIFTEAKTKAGIIKSVTFHSLRHSFATHLLEKGTDVIFIKDLLGHFDIKTTERYLHVRRDVLINIPSPIDSLYKK
jgi:integrase/recombinase XerD